MPAARCRSGSHTTPFSLICVRCWSRRLTKLIEAACTRAQPESSAGMTAPTTATARDRSGRLFTIRRRTTRRVVGADSVGGARQPCRSTAVAAATCCIGRHDSLIARSRKTGASGRKKVAGATSATVDDSTMSARLHLSRCLTELSEMFQVHHSSKVTEEVKPRRRGRRCPLYGELWLFRRQHPLCFCVRRCPHEIRGSQNACRQRRHSSKHRQ